MAEFKTVSLADQVFEKLEEDIIIGVYARGDVLTEQKLVEQLGVSRTPIREALRRLNQERLIKETSKGSVVLGITEDDLMDIMDIRQRIEGQAAYYSALNRDQEMLAELKNISELQDFYYEQRDTERLRQMDDAFHDTIYKLSGRPVLRDTLTYLHRSTMRYRKVSIEDQSRQECSVKEHKAIYEAIMAGDGERASALITEHITKAKESMIERCFGRG